MHGLVAGSLSDKAPEDRSKPDGISSKATADPEVLDCARPLTLCSFLACFLQSGSSTRFALLPPKAIAPPAAQSTRVTPQPSGLNRSTGDRPFCTAKVLLLYCSKLLSK